MLPSRVFETLLGSTEFKSSCLCRLYCRYQGNSLGFRTEMGFENRTELSLFQNMINFLAGMVDANAFTI